MYRLKNIHENLEVSRNMLNIAVPKNAASITDTYHERCIKAYPCVPICYAGGILWREKGGTSSLYIFDSQTFEHKCQRMRKSASGRIAVALLHPLYSHVSLRATTGTERDLFVRNQTLEAI